MADVDRQAIRKFAYDRLLDPEFRRYLTAQAPDGSLPLHIALSDDPVTDVLSAADRNGGNLNVVTALLNGVIVFTIKPGGKSVDGTHHRHRLRPDCTVGVLVARLIEDGGSATYTFGLPECKVGGQAQLTGVAA